MLLSRSVIKWKETFLQNQLTAKLIILCFCILKENYCQIYQLWYHIDLFLENHYIFFFWYFFLAFNCHVFVFDVLCTFIDLQVSSLFERSIEKVSRNSCRKILQCYSFIWCMFIKCVWHRDTMLSSLKDTKVNRPLSSRSLQKSWREMIFM